ncbi:hypothetical protein J23TS9_36980 [Paenibacillus sp. J23TS9]|nr:hypothetical protein J23TS9_36980 [Paenibacillus sp. J23TS9]
MVDESRNVTIHHVYQNGEEEILLDTTSVRGNIGDSVTIAPKTQIEFEGVTYGPVTEAHAYEVKAENEVQTVYYAKTRTVTIKYLEQGTNKQLAGPTNETGIVGATITLKPVTVAGFTSAKVSDTYVVKDNETQEYVFYYAANSGSNPNPGGGSGGGDNSSTPSGSSSVTPLPPAPPVVAPLPPAPPKLETDNHYNYINGYPDGTIKPENNISREEVAAIFYRLMDDATRSDYIKNISSYKDVEKTRWSNKNIATMENAGIITGYPDGTFKPGRQITRAEFAAIASRFDDLDEQVNTSFSDIKGHWAEKYIVSAANKGWIKGYPDGKFKPDQYITRAEAMAFINSVLNRKVKVEGIHENAKTWPDNTQNKWYYTDVLEATNYHEYTRNTDETETWEQVKPDRVYP